MSIAEDREKELVEKLKRLNNRNNWIVKVQFFDRDKGKWSEMLSPQVGFSETFVQDETTDEASVNFKWRSSERPNLKHMMWVRILHFTKGEEFIATYDEKGLPLNHNQYVLGDFQMTQSKDKSYWLVKMSLLEPIERMRFVVGETLAYTNQTSKTVTDGSGNTVTYVKEPYNHLTALERFLKVTPANCDNYNEGYDPHQNKSWYNRVKILDKSFLKNIPFDSDSFTEPDFFTILFKYDKSTGRTPCMYFDMDVETDLPCNLKRDEYLLKFLRQDGFDKPELKLEDLLEGAQNVTYKSSISNFATGVVSNVENLVTGSNTPFPFYETFTVPEINNHQRNLSGYKEKDSGWGIRVPFPIKKVNRIVKRQMNFNTWNNDFGTRYRIDDYKETEYIKNTYEIKEYNSLSEDEYSKNELFYYTEGDDFIYIKNYFCPPKKTYTEGDKETLSFFYYVEYEPLISTRLIYGEEEYCSIYNQVDSQVDYYKFQEYLKKYKERMNKNDLSILKKHFHYKEIFEIGSIVIDSSNKQYLITSVSYQNINNELIVVYQLNENHFRRNAYVRAKREIRQNSLIDYKNIKKRNTTVTKRISLSCENKVVEPNQYNFVFNSLLEDANYVVPQLALITTMSKLIKSDGVEEKYLKNFSLPIVIVPSNNRIMFIINFKDNAVIGKNKTFEKLESNSKGGGIHYTHEITSVDSQIDVLYTDPYGCVDEFDISLCYLPQTKSNISTGDIGIDKYNLMLESHKRIAQATVLTTKEFLDIWKNEIDCFSLKYYKDSLEEPNITYNLDFISDEIILTEKLLKASMNREKYDNLKVNFYSHKITLNDELKDSIYSSSCSFGIENNELSINFNRYDGKKPESIAVFSGEIILMIINNVRKPQLNNNKYSIFVEY